MAIDENMLARAPRCVFYLRTAVPGGFTYDAIEVPTPVHTRWTLLHPPGVGDLVALPGGAYRVVERCWSNSSWGSANWPLVESHAKVGPLLELIVERSEGPFRDQIVLDEDDD